MAGEGCYQGERSIPRPTHERRAGSLVEQRLKKKTAGRIMARLARQDRSSLAENSRRIDLRHDRLKRPGELADVVQSEQKKQRGFRLGFSPAQLGREIGEKLRFQLQQDVSDRGNIQTMANAGMHRHAIGIRRSRFAPERQQHIPVVRQSICSDVHGAIRSINHTSLKLGNRLSREPNGRQSRSRFVNRHHQNEENSVSPCARRSGEARPRRPCRPGPWWRSLMERR